MCMTYTLTIIVCVDSLLKNYQQKRIAFPVFDQSPSSILALYFPDGSALRFLDSTHEIRKLKTRNASRFCRLTLIKLLSLITPDPNNGMILLLLAGSDIPIVFVKRLIDIFCFILCSYFSKFSYNGPLTSLGVKYSYHFISSKGAEA